MKKILKIISIFLFICFIFAFQVKANSYQYVYLGGQSIGIRMNTGVYVAGKFQVTTTEGKVSPWKDTNIEVGDKIEMINGIQIYTNSQLLEYLLHCNSTSLVLSISRDDKVFKTNIGVVKNNNNESSIGLYIKDQIQGIGTMTFATNDGYFASLGHGIYENKKLIENVNGSLYFSTVASIKKSEPGTAGEKRASIDTKKIGEIVKNDQTGLYGKINLQQLNKEEIEVSSQKKVEIGPAKIYTALNDNIIKAYNIEIIEVNIQNKKAAKGIKFKVVDETLINKTGGIVQGMSGSPIVQNNHIIGAVSHVTVENPIYGYGMHIEFMLDEVTNIAVVD